MNYDDSNKEHIKYIVNKIAAIIVLVLGVIGLYNHVEYSGWLLVVGILML